MFLAHHSQNMFMQLSLLLKEMCIRDRFVIALIAHVQDPFCLTHVQDNQ